MPDPGWRLGASKWEGLWLGAGADFSRKVPFVKLGPAAGLALTQGPVACGGSGTEPRLFASGRGCPDVPAPTRASRPAEGTRRRVYRPVRRRRPGWAVPAAVPPESRERERVLRQKSVSARRQALRERRRKGRAAVKGSMASAVTEPLEERHLPSFGRKGARVATPEATEPDLSGTRRSQPSSRVATAG
jgi:hypothetical protein